MATDARIMRLSSWLCRDELERARLLDMSAGLRAAKRRSLALLAVAAVVSVPVYGIRMQVPLVLAAIALLVLERRAPTLARPEYVLAGVWVIAQVAIVASIALAGGPRMYMLSILVFPMLIAAPIYPRRVVAVGAVITAAAMIASGFAFMPHTVATLPPVVMFPVLLLVTITILGSRTLSAEEDSRQAVVVDPLTGLLNRAALHARAAELWPVRAGTDGEAAVIVGDIDHFKTINDEHGHAWGDAVIVEVAQRLASVVADPSALYRFGGEEFVVLLRGAAARRASDLAEELRIAVCRDAIAGLPVTMSLGVASSDVREREYARLFASADRALYRAKAAGRDCVRVEAARKDATVAAAESAERTDPVSTPDRRAAPRATVSAAQPTGDLSAERSRHDDVPRNFVIRTADERQHMLDLNQRLTTIARTINPLTFAVLMCSLPWLGWRSLVPVAIAVGVAQVIDRKVVPRLRQPEYASIFIVTSINASIGLGLAVAQQSMLFALPFLTIVMFSNAAAFPAPAATVMAAATGALMTGVALLIGAHQVLDNPAILVFPLALLGAVSIVGNAVGAITMRQRWAAATDELTGLLNRNALQTRTAELAQGTSGRVQSVALMVADLDHFKAINDQHGHACGDHVLVGVAERIQAGVRLCDPVYRIGGEEFVALLVGASPEPSAVAERIRDAVSSEPIAGIPVTVSIGVAISPAGEPFDYEALFAAADAALRRAKTSGRDRVRQAAAPVTAPPVAA